MTITGPGAGQLAISGNGASQVLKIDDQNVANEINVTITGLAFADGHGNRVTVFQKGVTPSDGTDIAGAIYNNEALTLSNVTISGSAGSYGGGIFNAGDLSIDESTINHNSAVGGGITNTGTLTLTNSTISDNSGNGGAGIGNWGDLTIINSTISGNVASGGSSPGGGGIDNYGATYITNATISGNVSHFGGGILNHDEFGGTVELDNTIVAANTASSSAPDISGPVTGSNNLIGDGTGMTGIANDDSGFNQVGTSNRIDPKLDTLAENGRPSLETICAYGRESGHCRRQRPSCYERKARRGRREQSRRRSSRSSATFRSAWRWIFPNHLRRSRYRRVSIESAHSQPGGDNAFRSALARPNSSSVRRMATPTPLPQIPPLPSPTD